MMRVLLVLVSLVLFVSADIFVDERGHQDACQEMCRKDYPLHTYPNPENLKTCERGCRFFSMVKVSTVKADGGSVLKAGDDEVACAKACEEAYPGKPDPSIRDDKTLNFHCKVGCNHGVQVHTEKAATINKELEFKDPFFSDMMNSRPFDMMNQMMKDMMGKMNDRPFDRMGDMMNDMMNRMNHAMSFSLSLEDAPGAKKDGEGILDGPKPILVGQPSVIIIRTSHSGILPPGANPPLPDMDDPFDEVQGSNTRFMDNDPFPKLTVKLSNAAHAVEQDSSARSSDWLECISRKAGVPRWLLLTTLFLCSLMFVWLCFAATGPVHQRTVYAVPPPTPAVSLKQPWSDMPYILPSYEKSMLDKQLSDAEKAGDLELLIDDQDEEAAPLPPKVHSIDTNKV